jgi:hypothetical protein
MQRLNPFAAEYRQQLLAMLGEVDRELTREGN